MKNKGLGRGLSAILEIENYSNESRVANSLLEEIKIEQVVPNPNQPRTHFDDNSLEELADSIASLGVIQPITVRAMGSNKYMIISGERRWRASMLAGLQTIPTYIRDVNDQTLHEMSLVENIQRQDLNPMEIATSLQRLIDECGVTQETVATRVGKKRSTVANYLRLLSLPLEVQAALKEEYISMGHAKVIASADDKHRLSILKKCVNKSLSVRATEEFVKKLTESKVGKIEIEEEFPESYTRLVEQLSLLLCEDIQIKRSKEGKGKIIIGFDSDKDIEQLLSKLEKNSSKN